jgi:hypothetical protein
MLYDAVDTYEAVPNTGELTLPKTDKEPLTIPSFLEFKLLLITKDIY